MAEGVAPATIEDLLTCSLCLELFKEPKTLTCLHSYCKECLNEMTKTTNKYDSIPCPLCRDETAIPESGIEGLPTNFFIKNLLEVAELKSKNESLLCSNCEDGLKAVVRCVECDEFFCQKCIDAHNRLKLYQEHKVVELTMLYSPNSAKEFHPAMKCLNHGLICKFYCKTCKMLVCRDCTVVDHPLVSHSVANLKDVADQCRQRSHQAIIKAEKHIAQVKQVQHTCREKKETLKTSVDTITTKLNERKDHLIQQFTQTIEGRSSEMISQLEQLILFKVEQNERDEGQLESDLKRMGNYVLYMRNLLVNGNDDEIMNMYDHLVRYVNDTSGRNPFWLDADDQESPSVSLKSEAGEDVLNSSVDHLVTTCLGELIVPNLQADNYELVGERGKVFGVGEDVDVIIKPSNQRRGPPTPPDLNLFKAKVLTPKQTVIQAKPQLHNDETISVRFGSYIPGRHRLAVEVDGNSLRGSPCTLEIQGEPDYSTGTSLLQKFPIDKLTNTFTSEAFCMRTDLAGHIFILMGSVMRVFDVDFNLLYTFEIRNVTKKPWNFALDSTSRVIVSDTSAHKLFVFNADGSFHTEIASEGNGPTELNSPLGIAADSYDNIAVCDAGNRRIQIFKPDGSPKSTFGNEPDGGVNYPVSVQFNSHGHIIVSESSLWFSNYLPSSFSDGGFDERNAVECVKIFSEEGQIFHKFGEPGEGKGQFWAAITLAVDYSDHIWVADFTYGSIQIFDEKGNLKEVMASKDKEKGSGWLSSMSLAPNGALLYLSAKL